MTTLYLIRHSIKERDFGELDLSNSCQIRNEKLILSCEGEEKALQLSKHLELQNIDELWASNYVRAISTAKYISENNNIKLNISSAFDERHYGVWDNGVDKEEFWINQFINKDLKNVNGESQVDVQNRMNIKIEEYLTKIIIRKFQLSVIMHVFYFIY